MEDTADSKAVKLTRKPRRNLPKRMQQKKASYKYIQKFKIAIKKQKDADPKPETTEGNQMHASK